MKLQGHYYDKGGIEQRVDHINSASWKGNIHVQNVGLASAWKSSHILVEQDPELVVFNPVQVFKAMEAGSNTDLLNPFGANVLDDDVNESQHAEPSQPGETLVPLLPSVDLEILANNEYV